jgi:hypothetical protein
MTQAAVAAVTVVVASPCWAQSATGEIIAENTGSLGVPVTASIQSACEFDGTGPSGSYAVPDLTAAWTNTFNFTIHCTQSFRVGIVSSNGALVVPSVTPPTGYTASAPYNVDLHLAGDSAASADSGLCDASNLLASAPGLACSGLRGPSTTTQGLKLTGTATGQTSSVTVSAPAYSGSNLLIGSTAYTDTLIVTIAATT